MWEEVGITFKFTWIENSLTGAYYRYFIYQ